MIHFQCPSCGKGMKVSDTAAGKDGKCPACGEAVHIPQTAATNLGAPISQSSPQTAATSQVEALSDSASITTGPAMIGISVMAAIIGVGLMVSGGNANIVGIGVIGLAGMFYLVGAVRWAVSGCQLGQLTLIQQQNAKIIELLKVIATKGTNAP